MSISFEVLQFKQGHQSFMLLIIFYNMLMNFHKQDKISDFLINCVSKHFL